MRLYHWQLWEGCLDFLFVCWALLCEVRWLLCQCLPESVALKFCLTETKLWPVAVATNDGWSSRFPFSYMVICVVLLTPHICDNKNKKVLTDTLWLVDWDLQMELDSILLVLQHSHRVSVRLARAWWSSILTSVNWVLVTAQGTTVQKANMGGGLLKGRAFCPSGWTILNLLRPAVQQAGRLFLFA